MLDQIDGAKYFPPRSLDHRGRLSSYLPHAVWRVSPTHIIVVWAAEGDGYRAQIIPWPAVPEYLDELRQVRQANQSNIAQGDTLAEAVLVALASYYGE